MKNYYVYVLCNKWNDLYDNLCDGTGFPLEFTLVKTGAAMTDEKAIVAGL